MGVGWSGVGLGCGWNGGGNFGWLVVTGTDAAAQGIASSGGGGVLPGYAPDASQIYQTVRIAGAILGIVLAVASKSRVEHVARGVWLEWFTVGYNSVEGIVALVAGFFGGSIALVGFGLDSVIEVTSGGVLLWRLRSDTKESQREKMEATALKIVGVLFLALAVYVGYEAATSLIYKRPRNTAQ